MSPKRTSGSLAGYTSTVSASFEHLASILCGTSNLELTIMPGPDHE